jgi:hypothetical protein
MQDIARFLDFSSSRLMHETRRYRHAIAASTCLVLLVLFAPLISAVSFPNPANAAASDDAITFM